MTALRSVSEVAWRGLVIAAATLAISYALIRLKVVVIPFGIALLLTTFLAPAARYLERRGWRRGLATAAVFLGFLGLVAAIITVIAPPVGDQFADLGPTIDEGIEDIEEWLIDGPLDLTRGQIDEYRAQISDYARTAVRSSSDQIIAGAVIVAEVLAGSLLALLATFFIVKDGPEMQRWFLAHVPPVHADVVAACGRKAWAALGGFLRGAALIGLVEGVIMALALALVGADLIIPVAVLTFFAAFFPVLGAIIAGIVATLVALVSGGFSDALIIAIVALVVQQVDNDLLAPYVYGRALRLHPLVVLAALTAGGTIGGIIGAFIAVPLAAAGVAVAGELWERNTDFAPPPAEVDATSA